jgi:hypothetical protein
MTRMGRMIRSAKMKLITPPKLIPPFHSTAASGTFPIEHTNETIEMMGPSKGPQILASNGCPVKNRCCQKLSGTQAARAPAISNPSTMSRNTAAHSITKMWETEVNPSVDERRERRLPFAFTLISMAAWPSIEPASP